MVFLKKNGTQILFELCASNCEIFHMLQLPTRREALILLKEKLNIQKEIALKNKSIPAFQKSFQHFL